MNCNKLLSLSLRDVQLYITNLEHENEKLRFEMSIISRINCILENIKRSHQKGYASMISIDRNKLCKCNEHLNCNLRRVAHESDIELNVWLDQYEKLMTKYEHDLLANSGDSIMSLRSRESSIISSGDDLQPEDVSDMSETEMTIINQSPEHCDDHEKSDKFQDSCKGCQLCPQNMFNDDKSNHSDKRRHHIDYEREDSMNDNIKQSVVHNFSVKDNSDLDIDIESSNTPPPLVIHNPRCGSIECDSQKPPLYKCEWPNCHQTFSHETNLTHHRHNHIRKSLYNCDSCGSRFLAKDELEKHVTDKHRTSKIRTEPHDSLPRKRSSDVLEMNGDKREIAINLVHKEHVTRGEMIDQSMSIKTIDQWSHMVQYQRLSPPMTVINDQIIGCEKSNYHNLPLKVLETVRGTTIRPEEYKRTRYSGVGRYRCPWPDCGYTPHFLRDLRRHMHKHTGEKKHKCTYQGCDFVSVWKTSLLQHQRKKHFMNVQLLNGEDNVNRLEIDN